MRCVVVFRGSRIYAFYFSYFSFYEQYTTILQSVYEGCNGDVDVDEMRGMVVDESMGSCLVCLTEF